MTADTLIMPVVSQDDLDAIMDLVRVVQWPHRRGDVAMMLDLGSGRVVVDDKRRVRAVGLWWPFTPDFARIGLVIVAPDAQGCGLGRRLMKQILADTGDRSVKLLATEAGYPLYEKLGFVPVGGCRQYQGVYTGAPDDDPAIRDGVAEDLDALLALDGPAFGAGRATALRALMAAGRTAILTGDDGIDGYAIERAFGRGAVVGPIVARSEDAAIRLFRALARTGYVRVDMPVEAETFGRHVARYGLAPVAVDSPVMVLGDWPAPTGDHKVFGLASHALG